MRYSRCANVLKMYEEFPYAGINRDKGHPLDGLSGIFISEYKRGKLVRMKEQDQGRAYPSLPSECGPANGSVNAVFHP